MKTLCAHRAVLMAGSLLLVGLGALAPASVHAIGNTKCSFNGDLSSPACTLDFVFDKQSDKTLKLVKLPTVGQGTIQFKEQSSGVFVIDVDFIEDLEAPAGPGYFEYDLTIDPGNDSYFLEAGLAIVGPPLEEPVFSAIKSVNDTPVLNLSVDSTNRFDIGSFVGLLNTIRVVDEYSVSKGSINSFQNSFSQQNLVPPESVPGPIPLLGAGAAFGFSRRLRSRLLAARRA